MASVDLQEKANFTRLSRLLIDKGTEALRNTFNTIHPPINLSGVLAAKRESLQRLKPRVINNSQWIPKPLMSHYLQFYSETFVVFRQPQNGMKCLQLQIGLRQRILQESNATEMKLLHM